VDERVDGRAWEEFLSERPLGVVATNGTDGTPHAVPVEVVVHKGRVYVWCEASSAKARNAARDARVGIVAYKGNSGVLIRGRARLIFEGGVGYGELSGLFLAKYNRHEAYGNDTLLEITPERVTTFD
jgi:uncharacterized pyridoxamine 5'-phosphate oxidase family protein